jgi:hypothetical protein
MNFVVADILFFVLFHCDGIHTIQLVSGIGGRPLNMSTSERGTPDHAGRQEGEDRTTLSPHDTSLSPAATSIAFPDTMLDLANWWCHYILQNNKLELFDELSEVLEFLAPIQEGSPLSIRLHCLVVWQELLKQTTPKIAIAANSDNAATTTIQPPPLESRTFEAVQDKLVLLHTKYFQHDTAALQEYHEVVRMLRVHHELSILYGKLMEDGDNLEKVNIALDQALKKGRDDIYFGDNHQIPLELQEIVVKENGLSTEKRMQGIVDIFHDKESELAVKWLLLKTQMVLLHWCECKIPGGTPELVQRKFRGIGVVTRDPEGGGVNTGGIAASLPSTYAMQPNGGDSATTAVARPSFTPEHAPTDESGERTAQSRGDRQDKENSPLLSHPSETGRVPPARLLEQKRKHGDDESLRSNTSNASPPLVSPSRVTNQKSIGRSTSPTPLLTVAAGERPKGADAANLSPPAAHKGPKVKPRKRMKLGRTKQIVAWTKDEDDGRFYQNNLAGRLSFLPDLDLMMLFSLSCVAWSLGSTDKGCPVEGNKLDLHKTMGRGQACDKIKTSNERKIRCHV